MIVRDAIAADPRFVALCTMYADGKTPLAASGLWGSCAPILAGLISEHLHRSLLLVTAHLEGADDARDDLEAALQSRAEVLPAWESLPGEGAGADEINAERTRLCAALFEKGDRPILVTPIQALLQPVPTPEALDQHSLKLAVGEEHGPESIAARLVEHGFERLDQVEEPGDFALRGGILDIFWTADTDPYRIEFFGDQVESIRQFEVGSQRSMRTMDRVRIILAPDPARIRSQNTTSFLNYLDPQTIIAFVESTEIAEIGRVVLERLGQPVNHFPVDAVFRKANEFAVLHVSRFPLATAAEAESVAFSCAPMPTFEPKTPDALRQLCDMAAGGQAVVFCENQAEADRLGELLQRDNAENGGLPIHPAPGLQPVPGGLQPIQLEIGVLHQGFIWNPHESKSILAVVPHHELFRRHTQTRRMRRVAASRPIESFIDLQDGDYVVHVLHGIGRFVGMRTLTKDDSRKCEEFLTLRFADDATIHVPVSQIDLVQKYVGAKAARPALTKLGGSRWQSTKDRVEEAVSGLATDLLRIQAAREAETGVAYPQDTHWQREFENAFPFTETPDQTTAIEDIKRDMTRPRSMDRLLCGDVGYGKTELSMRAAFKVIEFGKQVAVLVPTTVLAEQHFRTFRERLADYPFTVECINRFRSTREQKDILAATRKGQVDILIGTHRLLSKDVSFADLGLVIIDEEQRFGVEHKERLKHLRATVEVLTLSATPIPRTLHMAMIGLRDISSLATPPLDRRAISTEVCGWSDSHIREAIVRELNREGQIYFVHNRVHSIKAIAAKLANLVPEARLIIGHGQMHGDELEDVMLRFVRHEADILLCTSIIESGLDIPNANTIFIDRADWFGLADLHQLRGRVGRYKHRAYCYMLLSPGRPLTDKAAKRLKAIEQYSELGAGFRIAMRDLEIRGAGNILGAEQSGNIAAVGYELYCQLLEQTVRRMRGEPPAPRVAVHLELDVEAYIPRSYIPSDRQRMECYRRVTACRTPGDVEQLSSDLKDAFGAYPEVVDTLLSLTEIKVRAAAWNIQKIIRRMPDIIFIIDGEIKKLEPLFTGSAGQISIPDGHTIHWRVPENYFHGGTLLRILRNLFRRPTQKQEQSRHPSAVAPAPS